MFTTLIAEELRALISSTILMINSFFVKAIVWMCLSPAATVGGIPRDPASSDLIVALVSLLACDHDHSSSNHFVDGGISSSCSCF
jgi:hypothetical protein